MGGRILIVDDEESIRYSLRGILEDDGHHIEEAPSGDAGLRQIGIEVPDLLFLDIWMPGMDGMELLDRVRTEHPDLPVVMISGHGTIETAVQAIKKGAFDFIEKPLSLEKVVLTTNKALEFSRLRQENEALRRHISDEHSSRLTGDSRAIRELREVIDRVAPTDAWVLITGPNGTGKEIAARSIHAGSARADKQMVAVNCAAIPEELIESELFGHEKGAFTGADRAKTGKFELADGGTLFLDEIADMSLKTQAKILRILQEQQFEHVGGHKTIKVDVRVIAATNKDLSEEIKRGTFREDLYYRLKVFPLEIPALRERTEDIALLINEFVTRLVRSRGMKPLRFTDGALRTLEHYPWPGNVRELKNFVERMMILHGEGPVDASMLPAEFQAASVETSVSCLAAPAENGTAMSLGEGPVDLKQARADFEARLLEAKLKECDGNVSKLAKIVGMERSSLYRKLKAYDIQAD